MNVAHVKIASWDKVFEFILDKEGKRIINEELKIGDFVIIKTESHLDLARIVDFFDKESFEIKGKNIKKQEKESLTMIDDASFIRMANPEDFKNNEEKNKKKNEFLEKANEIGKKLNIKIKFVDFYLSLDGGKIVFAFVAPERVDFRDLVKNLSQEFHRSIRLHQINPREEMKIFSGVGCCGRATCCLSFLKNLGGVRTNFIEDQQLGYRGIDRLSGPCGRLKCCLAYENDFYLEQKKKMPALGQRIRIKDKEGEVVAWHVLRGTVDLRIDKDNIIEVSIE